MKFKHIRDCWNAIPECKDTDELEELFDCFPRWSGDWEWKKDEDRIVVRNAYYDDEYNLEEDEEYYDTIEIVGDDDEEDEED